MKMVVFADLHIYHPFSLASVSDKSVDYWYYQGAEQYVKEVVTKEQPDTIVFLGDVHHYNFGSCEKYMYFKRLVDILRLEYKCDVVVVVGNHDTSGSYNLSRAHVIQYVPKANYITSPQLHTFGDSKFVFLPFTERQKILSVLLQFQTDGKVYILSHNNIYLSDTFYTTPMVEYKRVLSILPNATLVNGHIHRFYAEKNYYQLGSVNPTSYKEYLNAVGCCVISGEEVRLYKNTHLFLVSINNKAYVRQAEAFLAQADEHDSIVFLRVPASLTYLSKRHQCVKAVEIME